MFNEKIHLTVKKDKKNKYYYHGKWNLRLQLCWDSREWMPWFWIEQLATELGKDNFMEDFRAILELAESRNKALFTLYILPEIVNWVIWEK